MRSGDDKRLYCCESIRSKDAAGNPHVLCAGVDLSRSRRIDPADRRDRVAVDRDVGFAGRGAGPIDDGAVSQDEIMGHRGRLLESRVAAQHSPIPRRVRARAAGGGGVGRGLTVRLTSPSLRDCDPDSCAQSTNTVQQRSWWKTSTTSETPRD